MKLLLDEPALRSLARGCAVLGTGGGGDPYIGLLLALQAVEEVGPTELVDLDDLPAEALIMPCGMVGAPTVHIEKIENGGEGAVLRDHLERLTGRTVAALMPAEIGGSNGLLPLTWAGRMGLPVVDADGMGRAFPLVPQVSMHLAGIDPNPCVMTDERGNVIVFRTISGDWTERLARAAAVEFGEAAAAAESSPVAELIAEIGAYRLVTGKISDVERRTTKGFVRGSVVIEGLGEDSGRLIRLELQNENLVALERGRVTASVPDLISVLDSATAEAIATERVRYGQRVTVISL